MLKTVCTPVRGNGLLIGEFKVVFLHIFLLILPQSRAHRNKLLFTVVFVELEFVIHFEKRHVYNHFLWHKESGQHILLVPHSLSLLTSSITVAMQVLEPS